VPRVGREVWRLGFPRREKALMRLVTFI
jgi:hypothetical protein